MKELYAALAKAQGEIGGGVTKDATNPHFKNKYATLAAVLQETLPALSRNGLALIQLVEGTELVTILAHSSGEDIRCRYPIAVRDMTNPQAMGAAITYARRYTAMAIIGVSAADDDDDGNGGNKPKTEPEPKREPKREPKPKPEPKAEAPKPEAPKPEGMRAEDALAQLAAYAEATVDDVYADLTRARVIIPEPGQPWDRDSWRVVDMGLTARAAGRPYDGWLAWAAAQMGKGGDS